MRLLLRTFALLAVLPYVGVVYLIATGGPSWSSVAYVVAIGLVLGGLVTLPDADVTSEGAGSAPGAEAGRDAKGRRRPRRLSRVGVVALAAVALMRACVAADGRSLHAFAAADAAVGGARLVDRLVDEGDVAVAGTRVLVGGGMLHDDRTELPAAMRDAYRAMHRDQGDSPSPFAATYLGLQRPSAFDLVVLEPLPVARQVAPHIAVIFLHGFAGGFDLPCWQVARAVTDMNVLTACPSTGMIGDWGSRDGEETLRATVDLLHARGIDRIVLAGLSNGGIGASQLAPRMKGAFAGLILISGADPRAARSGIPTLLVHGTADSMVSYDSSRDYAAKTGATLVPLDAGHFAMLVRSERANRAIRDFVLARSDEQAAR